jgi:hypothetical protein
LGLAFQPLLAFAGVDARLATGLLIVSCLVRREGGREGGRKGGREGGRAKEAGI